MTMRMVSAARYACDGCAVKATAWTDELPEGWCEHMRLMVRYTPEIQEEIVGHLCGACRAPEEK